MRIKVYILMILVPVLLAAPIAATVRAESTPSREYHIKAAFLYNFIKFVDWPQDINETNETITIGIIGNDLFGSSFETLKNKLVKDKKVIIRRFESFEKLKKFKKNKDDELLSQLDALLGCNVLFISSSEKNNLSDIIKILGNSPVLTVAQMSNFLESGGIINFVEKDKKVAFEINVIAAKRARLKIRSKLLRLAERVVEKNL